ncbi:hypothetical protein YC2023_083581 [Brassica napus]
MMEYHHYMGFVVGFFSNMVGVVPRAQRHQLVVSNLARFPLIEFVQFQSVQECVVRVNVSTGVGVGGTDGVVKDVGDGSYVLLPITCLLVPKRGNYMVNNEGNGDAIMGSQGSSSVGLIGSAPASILGTLLT